MSQHLTEQEIMRREKDFDPVLPVQFFEQQRSDLLFPSEMHLMAAVLEDAFATLEQTAGHSSRQQRLLRKETEEWFASTDTSWFFSFENICFSLGIEADFLRRRVARLKQEQQAAQAYPDWRVNRGP